MARRRGCRPISQLEGTAVATAIGTEISLLQSVSGHQPQQVVVFRPRVVSAVLTPALEALRLLERVNGPVVLIERPRQGCTVVSTEPVPSPIGTETVEAEGGADASEVENKITGEVTMPPASPGR